MVIFVNSKMWSLQGNTRSINIIQYRLMADVVAGSRELGKETDAMAKPQ